MWKYEVWMDGQCIIDSDNVDTEYETEEEALEEAKADVEGRIEQWKEDSSYLGETVDDFDISVKEG